MYRSLAQEIATWVRLLQNMPSDKKQKDEKATARV
jgi:hypothetical protein